MSILPFLRFCRDCLVRDDRAGARCRACGSPRVVGHDELAELAIAHIDCDAFYAAVEKRDRPELRHQPVIIGGGHRGVVATACYIARIRGVRSAMPMFKALKLCPDAVVLRPDMAKYAEVGRAVRDMMLAITPLVEPLSIDEAFLDLSGTERLHGQPSAMTLARFARDVEAELGISVSIGLSHNKFLAKIASDLEKPRGFSVIGHAETLAFLRDRPISMIWGVGEAMDRSLRQDGLTTIGQLQAIAEADLMKRYGRMGQRLFGLSRGIDIRTVDPRGDMKSISAETTFNHDLSKREQLVPVLRSLSEKVARRLKATELSASTITLKMKTADFRIRTRSRKLHDPTRLADRIFETGLALIEKEIDGTRFRLIGVGCADFSPAALADPNDLVDPGAAKRAKAEAALDRLRDRFGQGSIETGYTFRQAADFGVSRPARPHENNPASREYQTGSREHPRPSDAGSGPLKRL
ncbi:MAG TPA: DNA polymerase IV [Aurantimonas sp.]